MLDTLQEITGTLRRNLMRTIATGFAVVSGLFLLIVLQGAGNGVINSFEYNMGGFAFDAIHIFGGMTTMPYRGVKEGRRIRLDERDIEMTERNFPQQVQQVMPTVSVDGLTVSREGTYMNSAKLVGVCPGYNNSMAIKMLQGRFINEIDARQKRKSVVLGNNSVKNLFKNGASPLGKEIQIAGISYQVVGVYKTDEMSNASEFYAPYQTVSTIYNKGRFIDELTMNIRNIGGEEDMDRFMDNYIRANSQLHAYNPEDKRALWIWNQAGDSIQMNKATNILHTAFWVLGILTMLSGVVSVSNIMLISVKERTREFGIRRAIGARPWNIIRMVMLESVVITAIFGYVGMLLGIFFCEYMNATVGNQTLDIGVFQAKYFVDPTVDLSTCLGATIIIVIAGAIAGFFPAWKAVKIKAIDALRS